jgi:hypothetical protein
MDAAGAKDGVPFSLKIPPGAVKQPVTITITETVLPPKLFGPTTPGYVVEPPNLEFALPVALHVPWGNYSSNSPPTFGIYTAADVCTTPAKLPDSYVNAGFLQGTTQRLGIFFGGTPTPDGFL